MNYHLYKFVTSYTLPTVILKIIEQNKRGKPQARYRKKTNHQVLPNQIYYYDTIYNNMLLLM